jgi:hypothetical protein
VTAGTRARASRTGRGSDMTATHFHAPAAAVPRSAASQTDFKHTEGGRLRLRGATRHAQCCHLRSQAGERTCLTCFNRGESISDTCVAGPHNPRYGAIHAGGSRGRRLRADGGVAPAVRHREASPNGACGGPQVRPAAAAARYLYQYRARHAMTREATLITCAICVTESGSLAATTSSSSRSCLLLESAPLGQRRVLTMRRRLLGRAPRPHADSEAPHQVWSAQGGP